jgi:predicted MFS family arabinose efflux permease
MFIVGAGLSMVNSSVINLLVLTVNPRDMGPASSMNTVFRNLGNSVGAPIAGSILSTFTIPVAAGSSDLLLPSTAAFKYTFYLAASAFLVVALIVLFANEVLGRSVSAPDSEPNVPEGKQSESAEVD